MLTVAYITVPTIQRRFSTQGTSVYVAVCVLVVMLLAPELLLALPKPLHSRCCLNFLKELGLAQRIRRAKEECALVLELL